MPRTYTVRENTESRRIQLQTPGVGSSVFTYSFTVFPSSGTKGSNNDEFGAAWSALQVHIGVAIGKLTGISQYDESGGGSASPYGVLGSVRSINMDPEPDTDFVFTAQVVYQTEFPAMYDATTDPYAVIASGQACIGYRTSPGRRMMEVYKETSLPTSAQQDAAATAGGLFHQSYLIDASSTYNGDTVYSIDIKGKPCKKPIYQQEVTIEEPWSQRSDQITSGMFLGQWPENDLAGAYTLKRNDAEFMGYPAGTLLYTGTTTTPRQFHTHTLSHRFLYDEKQHFEQMTINGLYGLDYTYPDTAAVTVDSTPLTTLTQNYVLWVNYYDTADFSGFSWANQATATQISDPDGLAAWTSTNGPIEQ